MKIKLLLICVCILLGSLPIIVLIPISKSPPKNTTGFFRKFPPHFLSQLNKISIKENPSYIAGMDSNTIYLGHSNNPLKISTYKWNLNKFKCLTVAIKDTLPIAWKTLKSHVTGNNMYLMEGLTPNIFECSLVKNKLNRKKIDSIKFTDCLPITPSKFIIKTFDSQRNQNVLALITEQFKNRYIPNTNLKKQVDGFFCIDGDLIYNKEAQCIVYTYRYRNEFLIFNSNLNFISAKNTIDPNFQAQIKVSRIKEHGIEKIKLTSPPIVVNKKSYTQGRWLFLNSNVLSKNEDKIQLNSTSVIDIYELESGGYKYSFYIPSYKGSLMKDFAFNKNTLAVLYDQGITFYKMGIISN